MSEATWKKISSGVVNWLGFVWIARFYKHQKRENKRNRKHESKWFWFALAGYLTVIFLWLGGAFHYNSLNINVGSFIFIYVVTCLIMNYLSWRRWRPRDYSKFMESDKRLEQRIAPDQKDSQFPIAWNPKWGFILYGYRDRSWDAMVAANHLAIFGGTDQSQSDFVNLCIAQAWNNRPAKYRRRWLNPAKKKIAVPAHDCNTVVLCIDNDRRGLHFDHFKKNPAVVIIKDDDINIVAGALAQIALMIQSRAYGFNHYGNVRLVVVVEGYVADAFLGKSKELDHVADALRLIIETGKDYGVHLIINAKPDISFESVRQNIRLYLMRIQFFSRVQFKLTRDKRTVNVVTEAPKAYYKDLFMIDYRGELQTAKMVYMPIKDVMNMARGLTMTSEAAALAQMLRDKSFPTMKKVKKPGKVRIHDEEVEVEPL